MLLYSQIWKKSLKEDLNERKDQKIQEEATLKDGRRNSHGLKFWVWASKRKWFAKFLPIRKKNWSKYLTQIILKF